MTMIRVRGVDLHFEVHGRADGEPLVLLHGFTGTGQTFDPLLGTLGERYQVIVPDWRGHGQTSNPSETIVHAEAGRDIGALADALGIERAHFCGYSSGGMQLLFLALERPGLVHSQTLVAATYTIDELARSQVLEVLASIAPEWIDQLAAAHEGTHGPGYAHTLLSLWRDAVFREGEMPFTSHDLSQIACPTLIVSGDRDRFFPVRVPVTMYEAMPDAELCILPRCGHRLPYIRPQELLTELLGFLGEHPMEESVNSPLA